MGLQGWADGSGWRTEKGQPGSWGDGVSEAWTEPDLQNFHSFVSSVTQACIHSLACQVLCWQAAGLCSSGALWLVDGMDTQVTTLRLYGT